MSRRAVFIAALICLALLATAVVPWTISSGVIPAAIAKQLRDVSGLNLTAVGRHTIALLPVPRLKFEDITIETSEGVPIAQGGQLRGEFRIVPLLIGRLELSEVWLNGSRVNVEIDESGRSSLDEVVARLREEAKGKARSTHIRRLGMTGVQIVVHDRRRNTPVTIHDVNVVANWPRPEAPLAVTGSAVWRGERVDLALNDLRPAALVAGGTSRFTAELGTAGNRVSLAGEVSNAGQAQVAGRASVEFRSVRDLMRLTGLRLPLGSLMPALAADGEFTADGNGFSCPAIRMTLGADKLDGALSLRLEGDRPAITGTLAADRLDLTDFFTPLAQAWRSAGSWSSEPVDLGTVTSGDLDLRLSASSARLGSLRLEDLGAAVLVKQGRIEASLGRATAHRGVVKGRLTLAALGSRTDFRVQGSFDRMDVGALLGDLGQTRWMTGTGQGQVWLEGIGESPADLLRQANGRISVAVKPGELIGVGLGDVLKRVERYPLSASLDWRGGRTLFDQALITLNIAAGVGDVVDGSLTSPSVRALLQGRISLVERLVALRAHVDGAGAPASPTTGMVFDMTGPWEDIAVIPDVRALIQRSGAAKPLLGHGSKEAATRGRAVGEATAQ